MVLSNPDGHMFLVNDGNRCHEQHLGEERIGTETVNRWFDHVQQLASLKKERDFKFCFLPAPDKQSVYWSTLSLAPDHRNVSCLLSKLDHRSFYDPLPRLLELVHDGDRDPYPKVDTHWNSAGALAALEGVFSRWSLEFDPIVASSLFEEYEFQGDLGIKCTPKVSGIALNLGVGHWRNKLVYDNGVPDNGRIRLFVNDKPVHQARVLIVGDSFSYRVAELLTLYFGSVFHFHGTFVDRAFFRLIQPDFMLFEQTERFFIRSPRHSIESSFFRLLEEKIEAGVDVRESIERHRRWVGPRLACVHQSLVVAFSERNLLRYELVSDAFSAAGTSEFLRTLRCNF